MSANPEAFNYLRKVAYRFVQKHGKDGEQLHEHCVASLADWRSGNGAGSGLTDAEADQIVRDVTHWTITKYNPPRKKAERSREERAAAEISAPALLEFAAETYGARTVRNAARISGQSKSTVARHLRQQGISPKRQKKIDALPARVKWLVEILDATFPRDGAGLLAIDDLAAAIWDKAVEPLPTIARSTVSTRRKKLREYLAAVNGARISFHLIVVDDVVAVRRGRRFQGIKDTAIWVEEERGLQGVRGILLPTEKPAQETFWSDPWLQDVLALYRIGHWPWFSDPSELEPLLRLTRPLLDPRPLYHLFGLAIQRAYKGDFVDDLSALGKRVLDPTIRKAVFKIAGDINALSLRRDYDPHPTDAFDDAEYRLKFMTLIREVAPDSYGRIRYFRTVILEELCREIEDEQHHIPEILDRCRELAKLEQQGKWKAPSSAELAAFSPETESSPSSSGDIKLVRKIRTKGRLSGRAFGD